MAWDLAIWHSSAARNGITNIPVCAGEDFQSLDGTTGIFPRGDGYVAAIAGTTAAIANTNAGLGGGMKRKADANRILSKHLFRDQTGAVDLHNVQFAGYPFSVQDSLVAFADNNNNVQVDDVIAALVYGADPGLTYSPPPSLLRGSFPVKGLGGTTCVANTLTPCAITWDATFERGAMYQVVGVSADSATGYAFRFKYKAGSPSAAYRPGWLVGDTNILTLPINGDFGTFDGKDPPGVEWVSSGADTVQNITAWIRRVA